MDQQLYQLETDPALKRLVAPMDLVEFSEMEEEIRINGGARGVKVWGRKILVDYEYYEYCHREKIPFCLVSITLETYQEVVAWICKNQLFRKSLTEEMRKYLIGKRSLAERTIALLQMRKLQDRTDRQDYSVMKLARHNVTRTHVRERIGAEYSLVYITVRKYEAYVIALDTVCAFCPEFVEKHLRGKLKISFRKIDRLALLPPDDICNECRRLMETPRDAGSGFVKGLRAIKEDNLKTIPSVSIKDMPAYDPDAEIVSLSLTIPSWTSSIIRARDASNMAEISQEARLGLRDALISLKSTTDKLLYALREDSDERV